jgi:hypothetical protein
LITGGMAALLLMVIYTIATGKLKLTKDRVTYGTPARAAALLGLVPLMLLAAFAVRTGGMMSQPILLFLGVLVASVAVIYAIAWPFGETPRG